MTEQMNPEIKALWIDALRSGQYAQGRHTLRTSMEFPTFCCLGVLSELHAQQTGAGEWYIDPDLSDSPRYRQKPALVTPDTALPLGSVGNLTGPAQQWCGLFDRGPETAITRLVQLNDRGTPFSEIADWIEANV